MEWTTSFLPDQQIVVIQTRGVADEASSLEMAKNLAKTMIQYKATRCLIDHSAIASVSSSPVEILYRPRKLAGIGIPSEIKIAEVVLPAHKKHFNTLKNVCQNFGFLFRTFDDQESAIQWLTE
jgi:hypothetical protein